MHNDKQNWWRTIIVLLVFSGLTPVGLCAQKKVIFESSGPTREVYEGSRFEVSFTLKNTIAKRFVPPNMGGLQITGGPSEMRGAGFRNGQSYKHQSWTYELEAGAPGTYTIGPATVQTSKSTLRSQPLVIRVVKSRSNRKRIPSDSNDQVFITGELDRETAWLGQQLHYRVKLYTRVGISNYDILDLPQLGGFFAQERRRFDTRTQYQQIGGKKYAVRILHEMALFPQQAGELNIGVARVRLGVEQPGSLSALLGSRPVLVQTEPIRLLVKPLPEPEPAGFSGAVGNYNWQVTADKDSLTTDDALTLTIKIEGNGDVRRFAYPRFVLPKGLEGFEPKVLEAEEYETGDEVVHASILEYVILPRQPGSYSFMPELHVFDPDSNAYQTRTAAAPITLLVTPGELYGQNNTALDTIAGPPGATESPLGIVWKSVSSWLGSMLFWGVLLGLAVLLALFFLWRNQKQKKAAGGSTAPPKPSVKTARLKLNKVSKMLQTNDVRGFYLELLKAMQAYVSVYLDIEPTLLTKEVLQTKLTERGAPEHIIASLVQLWQKCEQAVFADRAASTERNATFQQAEAALKELDSALK